MNLQILVMAQTLRKYNDLEEDTALAMRDASICFQGHNSLCGNQVFGGFKMSSAKIKD